MTAGKPRTIWLLCLPACLFLPCQAVSCHRRPDWQRPCRMNCVCLFVRMCVCVWGGGRGGGARLSDGCPIHHGGPCWWAKEPTCGGEGEVVSEESALFDYSRSIIQRRAAQKLSVWWQPAEWLLAMCWPREKRLWKGRLGWYHLEDLGNQQYQWEGFGTGPHVVR